MLQGAELRQNVREGVIMGNRSLVLQSLTTHNTGLYSCQAANTVGKGMSNVVNLDIKCKWQTLFVPAVTFPFLCSRTICSSQKDHFLIDTYFLASRRRQKSSNRLICGKIFCHSFIILSTVSAKQLVKNISNFWDNASINFGFYPTFYPTQSG